MSKIAESLDNLLRDTQAFLKMNNKDDESAERKNDGETSMDSRGSIEVSWNQRHWKIGNILIISVTHRID